MASLLGVDDDQNRMVQPLLVQPPDPDRPDQGAALAATYKAITDEIARQRQISADKGLWTGGGLLEGGHPTAAGVVDAANQTAQGVLMGTTAPGPVRAFHGSPYDFNAFDTSKIGTGEGAQAYGHGLYFAENEGVAKGYRDALAQAQTPEQAAQQYLHAFGGDRNAAIAQMTDHAVNGGIGASQEEMYNIRAGLQLLKSGADIKAAPPGHMYEVGINADPDQFLHWDKTLDEQSPYVQAQLEKTSWYPFAKDQLERKGNDNPTGRDLHHWLMDDFDPHEGATMLNDAGIPGIRYLDQGSRGKGEGSHNYVVFDANTIDILRKYGIAGLIAGSGAAATQGTQQPPQQ